MTFSEKISNLSPETKKIFDRIFELREVHLELKNFEKFSAFQQQDLIFIKDKILNKEVIFNLSRKKRPQPKTVLEVKEAPDPFCDPLNLTPIDEIGRLENDSAITSANLSKMADYHSLIIFKKHNLLDVNDNDFINVLKLADEWFIKIKNFDPEIKNRILIWNYHYPAAASILHPHFQVLAYKDSLLKIDFLEERLKNYQEKYQTNYFDDYFRIANELKIGKEKNNFRIWISLTPEKENGLNFYGNLNDGSFFIWEILKNLLQIGVESFNIFYNYELKYGFFVDRGKIQKKNSDFGALEIFGLPIVSFDPFKLADDIFK